MYVLEKSEDPPPCGCQKKKPYKEITGCVSLILSLWIDKRRHGQIESTSLLSEPNKREDPAQRDIHLCYHRNKPYYKKAITFPKAPVHRIESSAA